jgi:hypothetical protein
MSAWSLRTPINWMYISKFWYMFYPINGSEYIVRPSKFVCRVLANILMYDAHNLFQSSLHRLQNGWLYFASFQVIWCLVYAPVMISATSMYSIVYTYFIDKVETHIGSVSELCKANLCKVYLRLMQSFFDIPHPTVYIRIRIHLQS